MLRHIQKATGFLQFVDLLFSTLRKVGRNFSCLDFSFIDQYLD